MQKLTINQNNLATSDNPIIWKDVFEGLLSYRLPLRRLPRKPDDEELIFIFYQTYTLHIGLHWAIKKEWNTEHEIPARHSVAKIFEPTGKFVTQLLLLCKRCYKMRQEVPIDIPYPNEAGWFGSVFWEMIILAIESAPSQEQSRSPRKKKANSSSKQNPAYRKKRNQSQEAKSVVLQIQFHHQLPITEEDRSMIATFKLLKVASLLAQKCSGFHKNNWMPFLRAWKGVIDEKQGEEWCRIGTEDGRIYLQLGKGRGKRFLSCPKEVKELFAELSIWQAFQPLMPSFRSERVAVLSISREHKLPHAKPIL